MCACVRNAVFQQLELDYTLGAPHPRAGLADLTEVPIVRMFGVTDAGNSVCLFVHGFEPYIYVEAPTRDFGPDDCESLRQHVNVRPYPRVLPKYTYLLSSILQTLMVKLNLKVMSTPCFTVAAWLCYSPECLSGTNLGAGRVKAASLGLWALGVSRPGILHLLSPRVS